MKHLIFGVIFFIATAALGAQSYKIEGSCEATKITRKEMCPGGMSDDHEVDFTEYTFKPKSSEKVLTKAAPCTEQEKRAVFEFAKKWIRGDSAEAQEILATSKPKDEEDQLPREYEIRSCTILTDPNTEPRVVTEINFPDEKFLNSDRSYDAIGLLIIGAISKNEIKSASIELNRQTTTDGRNEITFNSLCDVNGDAKAEIIFSIQSYYSEHWLIYQNLGAAGFKKESDIKLKRGVCGC